MFRHIITLFLLISGISITLPGDDSLFCNMSALTRAERERQHALGAKLMNAVIRRDELPDGYALVLDPKKLPLTELGEWVAFEARCCPFLDFDISLQGKGEPVTLRLTGKNADLKSFLREEIRAFRHAG